MNKNLAEETRKLAAESKALWNRSMGKLMPEGIGDLDDEMTLILRDSMKLMEMCWSYIDLVADNYEEQDRRYEETRKMLEDILKEVKKR